MDVGSLNIGAQRTTMQAEESQERSMNLQQTNSQAAQSNQQKAQEDNLSQRRQEAAQVTGIGSSLNVLG